MTEGIVLTPLQCTAAACTLPVTRTTDTRMGVGGVFPNQKVLLRRHLVDAALEAFSGNITLDDRASAYPMACLPPLRRHK